MNLCLEFLDDPEQPPIELKRSVLLIGRHPECDVRINLTSISRRHCCLAQVDDTMIVRDLGSRHGVWVNGRRVEERVLKPGDQLAIGPKLFKVRAFEFDHDPIPDNVSPQDVSDSDSDVEFEEILVDDQQAFQLPLQPSGPAQVPIVQGFIQDTSSNPERRIDEFWQNCAPARVEDPLHQEEVEPDDSCDESEIRPGLGLKL
jgi:pSer/pThr/pTyr-binding forkhead associated (FHA) protein